MYPYLNTIGNKIDIKKNTILKIEKTISKLKWIQGVNNYTNSAGLTQNYPDAINDEENTLKTVSEVLDLI